MAQQFPIIYLLDTHLSLDRRLELQKQIPTLIYDVNEAEVLLGNISRKNRALLELRRLNIATNEVPPAQLPSQSLLPEAKRKKATEPYSSATDTDPSTDSDEGDAAPAPSAEHTVKVVRLAWLTDSLAQGTVLPLEDYLIYEGRKLQKAPAISPAKVLPKAKDLTFGSSGNTQSYADGSPRRRRNAHRTLPVKAPSLVKQTTSEHDVEENLPPVPSFLHTSYSCQRPTPAHPPNEPFIDELVKIRNTRSLIGHKVGIRSYSTSIAAIAAYPHTLSTAAGNWRNPLQCAREQGQGVAD